MGETLSLVTLAEGVESTEQLDIVKQLGFQLAQGYLLGSPLPAEEALRLATGPDAAGASAMQDRPAVPRSVG
jgi:EAL domain-containing protein (putative c-di-GMP-specific phosphodiesterase class I)